MGLPCSSSFALPSKPGSVGKCSHGEEVSAELRSSLGLNSRVQSHCVEH